MKTDASEEIVKNDTRIDILTDRINELKRMVSVFEKERESLLEISDKYWTQRQMNEYLATSVTAI